MARPKKDKYQTKHMVEQINAYIDKNRNGVPILKECCFENDWNYDYVMQLQRKDDELSQSIKKLLMLKEVNLEKNGLLGDYDRTLAVFSLKQLGWRDKPEAEDIAVAGTAFYAGLTADKIGKSFVDIHRQILNRSYRHYDFRGGRGSLKSSFCGLTIVDELKRNPNLCAMALRRYGNTLKDSVYSQITWAIGVMGLESEFKCTVSPMQIVHRQTGQVVYFRGADEPAKIKSIKPPKDMYIGIIWMEEKDQFEGINGIRSIIQSVARGGDDIIILSSYNTPISTQHFINKDALVDKANRVIHHSYYYDSPPEWLGKPFFEEAEQLKLVDEKAYRHEYLGEAVGLGGNVFENVKICTITDDEISGFERISRGLDWGWYPDPTAYVACFYNPAFRRLYIFGEFRALKTNNIGIADRLKEKGVAKDDLIICDNSDNKAIADLVDFGFYARAAQKGPGTVNYSMKWLQGLSEIVIDNKRCPFTADEFLNYEYEKTKDGEIVSGYPDKDNHFIDATRYALNMYWKQRGV